MNNNVPKKIVYSFNYEAPKGYSPETITKPEYYNAAIRFMTDYVKYDCGDKTWNPTQKYT